MATTKTQGRQRPRRDGVGPDHPDRRQPRHLHQDRLRQRQGRRVPQHVVDLPRLQHLHEGQGPARRPLHHQPHLRDLRRQPRHLLLLRAEHGVRRAPAARSASGSSTSARPPSTCSTTTSSRRTWSGSTSARRWSRRPTRACSSRRTAPRRRTPADHGYKTIGDIMRSLNPFAGEFYREALQVSRVHARDVLPDGGAPRPPVDALPGRRRHDRDHPAVHRLLHAADALRRVHEARRADARRPLRLLLRGAARATRRSAGAASCSAAGELPGPRRSATSTTAT